MDEKISLKYQLVSAWCGPAFLLTFILFWGVIGHNLPNPSPALSAADLATRYVTNLSEIRFGFIVSLIIVVLYMPWSAVLATQMARIEGRFPVMAYLQLLGGGLTVMVVSFSAFFWVAAAFRPERDGYASICSTPAPPCKWWPLHLWAWQTKAQRRCFPAGPAGSHCGAASASCRLA